jgi:hypothetical protein
MNKEWLKFTAGVIGFVAVALLIAYVITAKQIWILRKKSRHGQSDRRYSERGSGDSGPSDRVGHSYERWAIGFGAEAEKSAVETKQAFLNDVDRFQQSKFWQYQVDGWAQGQQDLANTGESIKQLPQTLARVPGDIATGLVDFVRAVTGVKNANEEK